MEPITITLIWLQISLIFRLLLFISCNYFTKYSEWIFSKTLQLINFPKCIKNWQDQPRLDEVMIPLNWYSHLIFDLRYAINSSQTDQTGGTADDHLSWGQIIQEQLRFCLRAAVNRHLDRSRCRNSIMTSLLQQMLPDEQTVSFVLLNLRNWRVSSKSYG